MKGQLRRFPHCPHKQKERDNRDRMDMEIHSHPSEHIDGVILQAFGLRQDGLNI